MKLAQSPYQLWLRRLRRESQERKRERSPFRNPDTYEIPFHGLEDDLKELGLA